MAATGGMAIDPLPAILPAIGGDSRAAADAVDIAGLREQIKENAMYLYPSVLAGFSEREIMLHAKEAFSVLLVYDQDTVNYIAILTCVLRGEHILLACGKYKLRAKDAFFALLRVTAEGLSHHLVVQDNAGLLDNPGSMLRDEELVMNGTQPVVAAQPMHGTQPVVVNPPGNGTQPVNETQLVNGTH